MSVFNVIKNELKAAFGYQQTFEELIANGDIRRAINMMEDRSVRAAECIRDYKAESHKIMKREPKIVRDKEGNIIRSKELNKIAIPYPLYINEIALVFMYGRPPKWMNETPMPRRDERAHGGYRLGGLRPEPAPRHVLQHSGFFLCQHR